LAERNVTRENKGEPASANPLKISRGPLLEAERPLEKGGSRKRGRWKEKMPRAVASQ